MILITQPRVGRFYTERFYNELLAMKMAAKSIGWNVHEAHFGWRLPNKIIESNQVGVPYGSQTFCKVIAKQMRWNLSENSNDWLTGLKDEFLKREISFCKLEDVRKLDFKGLKFIKSVDGKWFNAKLYKKEDFDPSPITLNDTPVLVSSPVNFTEEYRCFVYNGKCYAISCYIYKKVINNPENWHNPNCKKAEDFVNEVLRFHHSEPAVIDVGLMEEGWAVIKTNQSWASGIYGCNPLKVLEVLEKSCNKIN